MGTKPRHRALSPSGKRQLWLLVIIFWGIWFIRTHNIMEMAVFVDESLHILRAQIVFDFDDATASILPGKLLLYYYLGLFNLQDVGGAFVARQAVALLALPGAALIYALTRELFQRAITSIIAIILYALTPFMIFFERMALSDTLMMLFGLALAWASLRLAKNPTRPTAAIIGLLFSFALLAKLIALPWLLLPPLALWLFGETLSLKRWRELVLTACITATIPLLPSGLYVIYQEIAQVENKQEVVTTTLFTPEAQSRPAQIADNLDVYQEAIYIFLTPALTVLLIGFGLWLLRNVPRKSLYLLTFTLSLWGFIVLVSAAPSTRYLVPGVPPLLIMLAAGLSSLYERATTPPSHQAYRVSVMIIGALLLLWVGQSVQFILNSWNEAEDLTVPERDTWEYFQNAPAGYGLREAAADLPDLDPHYGNDPEVVEIGGFVAACHTLRLYLPETPTVSIICPYFRWNTSMVEATLTEWRMRLCTDGTWYILADDQQPVDLTQLPGEWTELDIYPRPHDGMITRLFLVTATCNEEEG